MKKYVNDDFDPIFTSCENQYSSPANDLKNSQAALAKAYYGPNPDGVMPDMAGGTWTKKAARRMDEIINEANFLTKEEGKKYKRITDGKKKS